MKTILIISTSLLLLSCATTESGSEKGYWIKEKPLRGTREANRNHKSPYWQCVGNNLTNILDCNKK
tara:strand:- start:517 stop:714 length:198 start_codon:yes stop_codon:yes gene_type:complete